MAYVVDWRVAWHALLSAISAEEVFVVTLGLALGADALRLARLAWKLAAQAGLPSAQVASLGALVRVACAHVLPEEWEPRETRDAGVNISWLVVLSTCCARVRALRAPTRITRAIACVSVFSWALGNACLDE